MLSVDLKWNPAKQEFIRKHSNTPDINLIVVGLSLEQLRRNIKRCSTEGPSHGVGTDRPSKIA
jgi:hypothetical protein